MLGRFIDRRKHDIHHEVLETIITNIIDSVEQTAKTVGEKEREYKKEIKLQRFYTDVLDKLPIMIWAKDLEGNFIITNRLTREVLLLSDCVEDSIGHTGVFYAERARKEQPGNKDWYTFGEVCDASEDVVLQKQKEGDNGPHIFLEWGNIRGQFIALEVIKAPLYDELGNLIGTIGSGIDVTSKVNLYRQIIDSLENSFCKGEDLHCHPILLQAREYFKKYHFTGSVSVYTGEQEYT
jgi:PAS domain-containing protein